MEQMQVRVTRLEGEPRLDGKKYLPPSCPGYVYATSNDGKHAMFWSRHCDQYRIGDHVVIEVRRDDD